MSTSKPVKIGPMTYTYDDYVLQRVRGGGGLWVAFDADDNEIYVRTSRQGLIDLIDRDEPSWPCSWLVEVPSGNPEPDFPSDLYNIVECAAPCHPHGAGWRCDNGHQYLGLEEESRLDFLRETAERQGVTM